jgi:hypothetical protein
MKVIIAGSRTFNDYSLLCDVCNHMLQNQNEIEIVSGGANGADKLGEKYANEKGYIIKQFIPNWEKWGKSAGYIRNQEMAEYADALIAFHCNESRGTKHMIDLANKYALKVKVVKY